MGHWVTDEDRLELARSWVLDWQRGRRVPGVALVVTDREQTRLVELSGLADRAGNKPLAPEQRWQIGSISKAFTSIAVLQLVQAGQLRLDEPVATYLPWLSPLLDRGITLHHLMTHTAGLPLGSEWVPDSLLESAVQGTVGRPQPPGYRYYYSNPGYEIVGDVVEAVTGRRLEQHLEDAVLRPMGMTTAVAAVTPADRDRDVRGHRPPRDDVQWAGQTEQVPDAFFPTCTADGSIAATPDDVAVYLRFLLAGGPDGVLGGDGFTHLAGRHVDAEGGWYGYGLHTNSDGERVTLGHSGGMVGMFADVRVDRVAGIGTALLINGFGDVSNANGYALDTLCGLDPEPPTWPKSEAQDDGSLSAQDSRFVGLFRSYNPWGTTLRVIGQNGQLHLVDPVEGQATALHRESDAVFRVEYADSPDIVEFDVVVDGVFQRLNASGCVYGRARRT